MQFPNFFGIGGAKKHRKNGDALVESYDYGNQNPTLESILGNDKAITQKEVMSIPAIQASLELITSSIGQMPIKLYKVNKQGENEEVDDYRLHLLNDQPNETLDGYNFKKKIARDVLLYGTSKSYLEHESQSSNQISAIYPMDTKDLVINVYTANGFKKYGIDQLYNQSGSYTFYDDLLLSVLSNTDNGISGHGIIENNADTLRLAMAQNQYEQNLLKNGAMPTSVLETDQKMNQKQINQMRDGWQKLYEGAKNVGKTVILENGLHYKAASLNPDNLELTQSKSAIISDIARMFNIPESMINSSANKYDSNEQNNIYFLQYCLSPILVSIEAALNKTLLLEDEKDKYEFHFDPSILLKATAEDNVTITLNKFNAGVITNFDAKRILGSPINNDEKEYYKLTTGEVMFDYKDNKIINPNTGTIVDLNKQAESNPMSPGITPDKNNQESRGDTNGNDGITNTSD